MSDRADLDILKGESVVLVERVFDGPPTARSAGKWDASPKIICRQP